MYLKIEQRLPSLNDVINANRRNKYAGAKLKRETEDIIGQYITIARLTGKIKPVKYPIILDIKWHESTKKRDVDNIESSVKFILDALQKTGIIINDSRRYVKQIYHEVLDAEKDYIEIYITEAVKRSD